MAAAHSRDPPSSDAPTMNDREYRVIGVMPPTFEPLDAARFYNASAEMWAIGYTKGGDSSCRTASTARFRTAETRRHVAKRPPR